MWSKLRKLKHCARKRRLKSVKNIALASESKVQDATPKLKKTSAAAKDVRFDGREAAPR